MSFDYRAMKAKVSILVYTPCGLPRPLQSSAGNVYSGHVLLAASSAGTATVSDLD